MPNKNGKMGDKHITNGAVVDKEIEMFPKTLKLLPELSDQDKTLTVRQPQGS